MVDVENTAPRRPARGSRVPPHDMQAEESLLGAMMLDGETIAVAAGVLRADDFYKPAHAHIFDAIHALYAAGHPVDPVTVADELRRNGLLEQVGGHQVLVDIMASTPATTNASGYARIVEEQALLRRLIGVAGEIAEIGYSLPEDITKALDRAESMVYDVNQRRVTDTTSKIEDLLGANLDRLEQLYGRGEAITGVPTGYVDLDELLSGLQPSNLVIVGARPSMGKCVAWDTPIVDPDTGAVRSAVEVHAAGLAGHDVRVAALGHHREVVVARPSAFVDDGRKPVYRVRTRSGRVVRTTASHPFLTPGGWRPLVDLGVGQQVGVPAALPVFGTDKMPAAAVVALAQAVTAPEDDATAPQAERRVPASVFRLRPDLLARFIGEVLGTAASVWRPAGGQPGRVRLTLRSEGLAHDLQHLLLRFGICVTVTRAVVAIDEATWVAHELSIDGADQLVALAHRIGVRGQEAALGSIVAHARSQIAAGPAHPPAEPVAAGVAAPAGEGVSGERGERAPSGDPSSFLLDPAALEIGVATGAVMWDEVVAIDADGVEQVYDLTVPELHNFVAADVFVHNTSFALGMAAHAAVHATAPVLLFSLEMGSLELSQRLLCGEARIDSARVRTGRLSEDDWSRISQAIGRLASAPIWIDDNPNLTVMEIRAKARRLKSQVGDLGMVVVDYLQLMSGRAGAENRQVEVSEISRGLKILARELECPVIALSQLSRQLEMRADKRPMLADLRESGSIEQDADVVMFIYRDDVYHNDSPDRGQAEIIVSKHRNGPTGVCRLAFLEQFTRFANMAKVD
jgi:replicative DNA helicase